MLKRAGGGEGGRGRERKESGSQGRRGGAERNLIKGKMEKYEVGNERWRETWQNEERY